MSAKHACCSKQQNDTEAYRERCFIQIRRLCSIWRATNRLRRSSVEACAHTTDIVSREMMTGIRLLYLLDVHGADNVFDRLIAVLGW